MFQFKPYPIVVVYSFNRQKAVSPIWNTAYIEAEHMKGIIIESIARFNFERVSRIASNRSYQLSLIDEAIRSQLEEDLRPKYESEIREYEQTINDFLLLIATSAIGRIVLNSLLGRETIWIAPSTWKQNTATTKRYSEAQGGGIRILYNPKLFPSTSAVANISIDAREKVLFHELVHAARHSTHKFSQRNLAYPYGDSEEFFATQFENILYSSRKNVGYYSAYKGDYKSKENLYKDFAADRELCRLLKFFLQTEPLARQAAALSEPEYNPFRDIDEIIAKARQY